MGVEEIVGMYRADEGLKIGGYLICRQDDNSIWIQTHDGEGAQFSNSSFEAAIEKFYMENF